MNSRPYWCQTENTALAQRRWWLLYRYSQVKGWGLFRDNRFREVLGCLTVPDTVQFHRVTFMSSHTNSSSSIFSRVDDTSSSTKHTNTQICIKFGRFLVKLVKVWEWRLVCVFTCQNTPGDVSFVSAATCLDVSDSWEITQCPWFGSFVVFKPSGGGGGVCVVILG